jgi:hypothetical protein
MSVDADRGHQDAKDRMAGGRATLWLLYKIVE